MVDISGPGGHVPRDPYEDIRVHRVENEQQEKEEAREKFKEKNRKTGQILWLHFLTLVQKVVSLFTKPTKEMQKKQVYESFITHDLEAILKALEKLKTVDFSQDVEYLNHVSRAWHTFLEDSARFKKDQKIFTLLEVFIELIQEYPEDEEHSLGYYLAEYAGSEWLPFPFMELLQNLHQEHKKNPLNSHLAKWVRMLKAIVMEIKAENISS